MKITSKAFENNKPIPRDYTCDGQNISPALEFSEIPEKTESLVLIMDDPDAPMGCWDHWVVFNIPFGTKDISKGEEPPGIHGRGTSGNLNYHGPCPPDREHRYFFKLYALDGRLDLSEGVSKKEVESAMEGHILETAELIGLYKRE